MRHLLLPKYKYLRDHLARLHEGKDEAALRSFDRKFQELNEDRGLSPDRAAAELFQEFDDCLPLDVWFTYARSIMEWAGNAVPYTE